MTDPTPTLSPDTVARLLADTSPYISCDECFARLDEYTERRARDTHHDDPAMAAHLRGCGACAEEADALLELLDIDAR
jgi:hypothetical protein